MDTKEIFILDMYNDGAYEAYSSKDAATLAVLQKYFQSTAYEWIIKQDNALDIIKEDMRSLCENGYIDDYAYIIHTTLH